MFKQRCSLGALQDSPGTSRSQLLLSLISVSKFLLPPPKKIGPKGANLAPRVRWDRSFRELGRPACRMPANCAKGARGSGPRGRGSPSSPRSSVPDEKVGRRREAEWSRRLAVPLAPAPAPLPFQGLFRAEPWESVSPVAEISLEPARRGCKLPSPPRPPPGRPPEPGRGRGAAGGRGVRLAATRGQRPQLDRPPPARRRGLNAVNQSISPRSPPRNPERRPPGLLCVSPACLPGAWEAGPGRCGVRGARRVPTSGRGGLKATLSCPTR